MRNVDEDIENNIPNLVFLSMSGRIPNIIAKSDFGIIIPPLLI